MENFAPPAQNAAGSAILDFSYVIVVHAETAECRRAVRGSACGCEVTVHSEVVLHVDNKARQRRLQQQLADDNVETLTVCHAHIHRALNGLRLDGGQTSAPSCTDHISSSS
ncbi:hypothetical protein JOB18_020959 [Solea senegalensis]|uniref:Uncharacterized protein n=1 Tax=Solea senegalensis TaxID=28829 RepID=A0AAV6S0G3_SOLSE|nr:hypothetical protein JOB18_020959 [Solea senegalensis]